MHEKSTGGTILSVFDQEDGKLLAKSCGSYIDAAVPIDFSNTDENGDGNFTIGAHSYLVHSESHISGGPTCSKKYNGATAIVDCENFKWDPKGLKAITDKNWPKVEEHPLRKKVRGKTNLKALPDLHNNATLIQARQADQMSRRQCDSPAIDVLPVGDGDPHQNYYMQQPGVSCSIMKQATKDFFKLTHTASTGNNHLLPDNRLLYWSNGKLLYQHQLLCQRRWYAEMGLAERRIWRCRDLGNSRNLYLPRWRQRDYLRLAQYCPHCL